MLLLPGWSPASDGVDQQLHDGLRNLQRSVQGNRIEGRGRRRMHLSWVRGSGTLTVVPSGIRASMCRCLLYMEYMESSGSSRYMSHPGRPKAWLEAAVRFDRDGLVGWPLQATGTADWVGSNEGPLFLRCSTALTA